MIDDGAYNALKKESPPSGVPVKGKFRSGDQLK